MDQHSFLTIHKKVISIMNQINISLAHLEQAIFWSHLWKSVFTNNSTQLHQTKLIK